MGIGGWDSGLGLRIGDWGLELGIGIGELDWGLGIGIGHWGLEFGIRIGDWDLGLGWGFVLKLEVRLWIGN